MAVTDFETDRLAQEMIARHGPRAARVAAQRVNEMFDCNSLREREIWAGVVHLIHERLGASPLADRPTRPQLAA